MCNISNITKYTIYEGYESSYDYIVYEADLVFTEESVEEAIEESDNNELEEIPEIDYSIFDLPGTGGNVH